MLKLCKDFNRRAAPSFQEVSCTQGISALVFPGELPSGDSGRILAAVAHARAGSGIPDGIQWGHHMKAFDTEHAPHFIRTLDDAEIGTVGGGEVKITGQAYIPFVGTFLWFSNGGLSFMGDDWTVINDYD